MSRKEEVFKIGFRPVRDKVSKGSSYIKSCYNCDDYYQASGDKTEVCQNPAVLRYDMVVTESSIYCNQWTPCKHKNRSTAKSLFRKDKV